MPHTPTVKITKLVTLSRGPIEEWFTEPFQMVVSEAETRIAEWANCSLDEVGWEEFEGMDFLTVDGSPVAFLHTTYARAS